MQILMRICAAFTVTDGRRGLPEEEAVRLQHESKAGRSMPRHAQVYRGRLQVPSL